MKGRTAEVLIQLGSDISAIRASRRTKPGGLTCDDYIFLLVAGPSEVPTHVGERLAQHRERCRYRHGGLADFYITPDMEEAALRFIQELAEKE